MKIESGIELPPPRKAWTEHGKIALQMKVGDSVLCRTEQEMDALRYALKNKGWRAAQRKAEGGWRVWRVE